MENKKAAAVILAAGYSSRMGEFKPLLPIDGKSALENLVESFIRTGVNEIIVVTGHNREKLLEILGKLKSEAPEGVNITEAYNPDFAEGMFTSVKAGIRTVLSKLSPAESAEAYEGASEASGAQAEAESYPSPKPLSKFAGVFLLPVDYPLVAPEHLDLIYSEAVKRPASFIAPCYMGKKGHPLWIPKIAFREIADFEGNGGLKAITNRYDDSGLLVRLEVGDEAVVLDMDTRAGYEEVLQYVRDKAAGNPEPDFRGRIILIRHGRTAQHNEKIFLGQYDVPLDQEGRHEAFNAGLELADMKPNSRMIYTSDLARAAESAEIIRTTLGIAADGIKPEIVKVPEFREMSLGDWDGRFISDIKNEFPEEYEKRGRNKLTYKRGHEGENFYDLQYRVMKKLKQLVRAACLEGGNDRDIIIVAHRGVLKVIICNLLGYSLDTMDTFDVPRGSVTNLDFRIRKGNEK